MKKIISLVILAFSLPGYPAPAGAAAAAADDAAAAAYAAQAKKTAAEQAEHAQNIALSRIMTAIDKKNIEVILKWLGTITDELDHEGIFESVLNQLSPADFRDPQINTFQELARAFQRKYGRLPRAFTLPAMHKKWGPYLLAIYPREGEVKSELQKPRAPSYPAPTIERPQERIFLIGKAELTKGVERYHKMWVPRSIASNPAIAGDLISTMLENDPDIREIPLNNIPPYILAQLVAAFRDFPLQHNIEPTRFFDDYFHDQPSAHLLPLITAANYLGAQPLFNALVNIYSAQKLLGRKDVSDQELTALANLPLTIWIEIDNRHKKRYLVGNMQYTLLRGSEGDKVPFYDRDVAINEGVVGPIISRLVKTFQSAQTRLPVSAPALATLFPVFKGFYQSLQKESKSRKGREIPMEDRLKLASSHLKALFEFPREFWMEYVQFLHALQANVLRDAFIIAIENTTREGSGEPLTLKGMDKAYEVLKHHMAGFTEKEWVEYLKVFHKLHATNLLEVLVTDYVDKYRTVLDKETLQLKGYHPDLQQLIEDYYSSGTAGRKMPMVSDARLRQVARQKEHTLKDIRDLHPTAISPEVRRAIRETTPLPRDAQFLIEEYAREPRRREPAAGRASPPPPSAAALPLERQSSGREQVRSPDSEAARKKLE